ncbi:MAG: AraC family transcriptional regulator [Lachnospiraceae bacterium]|nr:AraC family transcriptional regulator [Lachnospiraceae bacterium]
MIKIHAVAYQYVNLGGIDVVRPQGSGDYLLVFLRCNAEVMMDGSYTPVEEGNFILYKKGQPQIYRKLDGHYINDWMHFNVDPYDDYFEKLGLPCGVPFKINDSREITNIISDLMTEFFRVGGSHERILDQMADTMFMKLSDIYQFEKQNSPELTDYFYRLSSLRKSILDFSYRPQSAADVAEELHISVSYLQHLYRDFFNTTLNADMIKGRVDHAARLLTSGMYTVSQVAVMCGYDNIEHFSRQFKKLKNVAPSRWRG